MAKPTLSLAVGLIAGIIPVIMATETCGDAQYDPAKYVCYDDHFLCPVIAGEPLSLCNGACYSTFQYTCTSDPVAPLAPLTPLAAGTPFSLTASNPSAPAVDGKVVSACNQRWSIGGPTCAYCPSGQVSDCPAGNSTDISAGDASSGTNSMDVEVPGGQQIFLDPFWAVGYTQAHSASMPSGATVGGLVAYSAGSTDKPGGFINLNSGGWGWVACPPTSPTGNGEGIYTLYAVNSTNYKARAYCTPINLEITVLPKGTVGAWQYT